MAAGQPFEFGAFFTQTPMLMHRGMIVGADWQHWQTLLNLSDVRPQWSKPFLFGFVLCLIADRSGGFFLQQGQSILEIIRILLGLGGSFSDYFCRRLQWQNRG